MQQHLLQYLNTNIMNAGKVHHPHIWECGGREQSPWRVLILWLCEKKNITACLVLYFGLLLVKNIQEFWALFWATFSHIQEFWALFGLLLMANWAPKFLRTWQHWTHRSSLWNIIEPPMFFVDKLLVLHLPVRASIHKLNVQTAKGFKFEQLGVTYKTSDS